MSLVARNAPAPDMQNALREITRLIRVGLPSDHNLHDSRSLIASQISAVKREMNKSSQVSEIDRLRILTLEAEYHQQCGKHEQAAKTLANEWEKLRPRLEEPRGRLEPTANGSLLRQKIWLLLNYVSYWFYRVRGEHELALRYFQRLRRVIESELQKPDYVPYGTLALCDYYIGLCHRVKGGFLEAERYFLEAQKCTFLRSTREMERKDVTPERKQYESDYKDVFSARILWGLAWVAAQQGQLLRAEQHLRTAQNFLVRKRQAPVRILIDSLICIVNRRATSYEKPLYAESLDELARLYQEASGVHELTRLRCALELVRAYVDLAEFSPVGEKERRQYLDSALKWLGQAELMPGSKADLRVRLHRIRYCLVKGDLIDAERQIKEFPSDGSAGNPRARQRGFLLLKAMCKFARHEYEEAAEVAKHALREIAPHSSGRHLSKDGISDPVLEAECCLLWARISVARGDHRGVREYFGRWQVLAPFVENHYLHFMARKFLNKAKAPFFLEYDYEVFDGNKNVIENITDRANGFERWLLRNAIERFPDLNRKEIAKIYGLNRSSMERRHRDVFPKSTNSKP